MEAGFLRREVEAAAALVRCYAMSGAMSRGRRPPLTYSEHGAGYVLSPLPRNVAMRTVRFSQDALMIL